MKAIYSIGGEAIFHDPGPEMIPVFSGIDPSFSVQSIRPMEGFVPKFHALKEKKIRSSRPLLDLRLKDLTAALRGEDLRATKQSEEHEYSCLHIAHGSALRVLSDCSLCGWDCRVNRFAGEKGRCGLGNTASCSPPFVHIAEEAVINPAVVTNLRGCALRCQYCIDYKLWEPAGLPLLDSKAFGEGVKELLPGDIPINSIEFTNPTESLPGIIGLLAEAPEGLMLPVVFNCHLYGSKEFYEIGDLVTDVWLPDLRYGNNICAKKLSKIDHYMEYARLGLDFLSSKESRVIVRILVLPGHVDCCHKPALELLSGYQDKVSVSILDQFVPEYQAQLDPNLKRRPTSTEIEDVRAMVGKHGLKDILADGKDFWLPRR